MGQDEDYDWRKKGDRRKGGDRRRGDERRGALRWDPQRVERRGGADRRKSKTPPEK